MLSIIRPGWAVSSRVEVFATTRLGGVSKPPFDTMNLGLHVGDDPDAVKRNRNLIADTYRLPGEPVWLNQTHSARVMAVHTDDAQTRSKQTVKHTDGSYTCLRGLVLAILTADCLPVVICDEQGTQCAVVHAGWRGLSSGILTAAMRHFNCATPVHAWLGPAIGPTAFEVGDDVLHAFTQQCQTNIAHFQAGQQPGKYMANIYALARGQLHSAGCTQISGGDYCTFTQSELFHSHRRDGVLSGRMATYVWLS